MSETAALGSYPVSFDDVQQAHARVQTLIHRTPVITCQAINDWVGTNVFLKCENLQKTGAFKIRGAMNAVAQMSDSELAAGVVTHSSGNHAGAISAAARQFGCQAHIVMPKNSPSVKKAAVRFYGGQITECEPTQIDREKVSSEIQAATGAVMIPPFDHPHVIAGQGTCAKELLEQQPDLDAIVSPVGGGGLVSGTVISARHFQPGITVWGAEPLGADDAFQSKQKNERQPQLAPNTICDGLRTGLGHLTWPYVRDQVDEILLADDEETVVAMRFAWERSKLIIEASSAVVLAALKKKIATLEQDAVPQKVGVIIGGGNVDLGNLPW